MPITYDSLQRFSRERRIERKVHRRIAGWGPFTRYLAYDAIAGLYQRVLRKLEACGALERGPERTVRVGGFDITYQLRPGEVAFVDIVMVHAYYADDYAGPSNGPVSFNPHGKGGTAPSGVEPNASCNTISVSGTLGHGSPKEDLCPEIGLEILVDGADPFRSFIGRLVFETKYSAKNGKSAIASILFKEHALTSPVECLIPVQGSVNGLGKMIGNRAWMMRYSTYDRAHIMLINDFSDYLRHQHSALRILIERIHDDAMFNNFLWSMRNSMKISNNFGLAMFTPLDRRSPIETAYDEMIAAYVGGNIICAKPGFKGNCDDPVPAAGIASPRSGVPIVLTARDMGIGSYAVATSKPVAGEQMKPAAKAFRVHTCLLKENAGVPGAGAVRVASLRKLCVGAAKEGFVAMRTKATPVGKSTFARKDLLAVCVIASRPAPNLTAAPGLTSP
jgi:hypothetical protein